MVSAARAQYLNGMRGFQSNSLALFVNSLALMGRLAMLRSVASIMMSVHERKSSYWDGREESFGGLGSKALEEGNMRLPRVK